MPIPFDEKKSHTYISVVNGKKMKPRHGRMNVLNVTFIATGRAIQYINNMMREKAGKKALKQPALLFLISISFPSF